MSVEGCYNCIYCGCLLVEYKWVDVIIDFNSGFIVDLEELCVVLIDLLVSCFLLMKWKDKRYGYLLDVICKRKIMIFVNELFLVFFESYYM